MVYLVLDKNGRAVFPKKIRDLFGTNVFEVVTKEKKIILKPKESLLSLAGRFPKVDVEGFMRERKKEIASEDFT